MDYGKFFERATGFVPMGWQAELANDANPKSRLIRIPTGFGKTAGVTLAWLWNRVNQDQNSWPRRLVFCLPMRVLVEQTEVEIRSWLAKHNLLWDGSSGSHSGKVGVHVLMGGSETEEWHLYPEHPAILIGTQDMLISRALNRGYACPRARWPMEFALLNQDCLWVLDEVQLMDVGLATSAQLQKFRNDDKEKVLRASFSWWMSATLQPEWLKSVDTSEMVSELGEPLSIAAEKRIGDLWSVKKTLQVLSKHDLEDIAQVVLERHGQIDDGPHGKITLVVMNTVKKAIQVYEAIKKNRKLGDTRLVHSRFRGSERSKWREKFLSRESCKAGVDRVIVATQVVEAGVDISAGCLVTELAPWPNLVQRFGRAARYGGTAQVFVVHIESKDEKTAQKMALPYTVPELEASFWACQQMMNGTKDVAQAKLEEFEAGLSVEERTRLYPYEPMHLLIRRELDELFDTTPDLTGADLDISRFIRSGDERDLQVFWRKVEKNQYPSKAWQPERNELCPVGFLDARDWVCEKKSEKRKNGCRAWVWNYLEGEWKLCQRRDLIPGSVLLVDALWGGYDTGSGFSGSREDKLESSELGKSEANGLMKADLSENQEELSEFPWKTIATHNGEVGLEARNIAKSLAPSLEKIFNLAGRWHDLGKAHPAFQACIKNDYPNRPERHDLAKAPNRSDSGGSAWHSFKKMYVICVSDDLKFVDRREGFRHELASTLALFGVLLRCRPGHDALLGAHREICTAMGYVLPEANAVATPLEEEILALTADEFNLMAYLVCSHHGKVRATWHSSPSDQDYRARDSRGLPIRGIRVGDKIPKTALWNQEGTVFELPEIELNLEPANMGLSPVTGSSWTERVSALLRAYGPFGLAYLETILRVADIRASGKDTLDPLLSTSSGLIKAETGAK